MVPLQQNYIKMKKLFFALIGASLIAACSQKVEEVSTEQTELPEAKDVAKLDVISFNEQAAHFVDAEIELTGLVDHVCKHGGKKLLLVADGADVHVTTDESRFNDELIGSEVTLLGIVREKRIDEGTCLQMEEDNIAKHKEGETNEEDFTHKQQQIKMYRDSMATAGLDHLSFYSVEFVQFVEASE